MIQTRTYQYKLNPTASQQRVLGQWIGACRYVYNLALDYKKTLYKSYYISISKGDMQKELSGIAREIEWIGQVHSQTLQDVTDRLYKAYETYFRKIKSGEIERMRARYIAASHRKGQSPNPVKLARMGKVNFAKKGEFSSFAFKQGVSLSGNCIKLPKLGAIRYRNCRSCEGLIKYTVVSQKADGWYVSLSCQTEVSPMPLVNTTIGIDLGIKSLLVTSSGETISNPLYFKKAERKLKQAQRAVSRKKLGSSNRKKAQQKLALHHQSVVNSRRDYHHKITTRLISENQAIYFEDLNIMGMLANHHLAKAIADAGWDQIINFATYKGKWYGRTVGLVNPRHTSQDCSVCGHRNGTGPTLGLTLEVREWTCHVCQTVHDRDLNAAQNIKNKGLGHSPSAWEVGLPTTY